MRRWFRETVVDVHLVTLGVIIFAVLFISAEVVALVLACLASPIVYLVNRRRQKILAENSPQS